MVLGSVLGKKMSRSAGRRATDNTSSWDIEERAAIARTAEKTYRPIDIVEWYPAKLISRRCSIDNGSSSSQKQRHKTGGEYEMCQMIDPELRFNSLLWGRVWHSGHDPCVVEKHINMRSLRANFGGGFANGVKIHEIHGNPNEFCVAV